MKILVKDNKVIYKFNDSDTITLTSTNISAPGMIICDCNSSNTTLYENVNDVPIDYKGHKYLYDGTTWSDNSEYEEPVDTQALETRIVELEDELATKTVELAAKTAEVDALKVDVLASK